MKPRLHLYEAVCLIPDLISNKSGFWVKNVETPPKIWLFVTISIAKLFLNGFAYAMGIAQNEIWLVMSFVKSLI